MSKAQRSPFFNPFQDHQHTGRESGFWTQDVNFEHRVFRSSEIVLNSFMAWVLFFDGDCAFCSAGVRRVMRFDTHQRLKFSPLQGKLAAEKGFTSFAEKGGGSMVLLRESDGAVFTNSGAAIELARVLGGWWRLFLPAVLIPKCLRDAVYQWVARHREWFSKKGNFCTLPDPEMAKRILE